MTPAPTIRDFINAFTSAIRGEEDVLADKNQGSLYEVIGGAAALIWSRQAQRDDDLFGATLFDTAVGQDLTDRIAITDPSVSPRILDDYGYGVAIFTRTSGAAADTIYTGTRVGVGPNTYETTADGIAAIGTTTLQVPIRSTLKGTGNACTASSGIVLIDILPNSTWSVASVQCSDGTDYEDAPTYRARVRLARQNAQVGFIANITAALNAVGAVEVIPVPNTYPPILYVGDAGYTTSPALYNACIVASDTCISAGSGTQIRQMQNVVVAFNVNLTLKVPVGTTNTVQITQSVIANVEQYMNTDVGKYRYTIGGLKAAIYQASPLIQTINFITPSTDAPTTFGAVLSRYQVDTNNFGVTYA